MQLLYSFSILFAFWCTFCPKCCLLFAESLLISLQMVLVWSAKSKMVLKAAATGSVTKTFAQVFASDKLSLCRKVKS